MISFRDKGGLIFPSVDTYEVFAAAEFVIRKNCKENILIKTENESKYITIKILKSFIGKRTIFINLKDDPESYGADHKLSLIKMLIEKYLMIRLYYIAKLDTLAR